MNSDSGKTSKRKKEHLDLCLTDKVAFKNKSAGFEYYDFYHNAITEVEIDKINFNTDFLRKKINYPFLISCMTGGTVKAKSINAELAIAAQELNIPIGVGSQRQAVEDKKHINSYKIIRKNAPSVPVLANIGAAEVVKYKSLAPYRIMIDMVEADALVIHINSLQELIQPEGEPNFKGLLKRINKLVQQISVPVIVKEVGAGISPQAAEKLLGSGVEGIDVAGAGGTSWAGVEILRNNFNDENVFWDWGLPTTYCIKEIFKLKRKYDFTLVGSGGIYAGIDVAKGLALGADLVASARIILKELDLKGTEGVKKLITNWFEDIKRIMFLTGSQSIKDLRKDKLIRKELLF
ncbi:MAG: type 2 isopentenyl-diphosphate Delta-isomerase [Ignavibacteriaceae bacterium]|nr:type 2 isopentenyl-diphosphate Delta-isomerase [Ignavibacteriaceae bacterium]